MTQPLASISKKLKNYTTLLALVSIMAACTSSSEDVEGESSEPIAAPIAPPSAPSASEGKKSQFEGIPGADKNDVEVVIPYNSFSAADKQKIETDSRRREAAARQTDREVAGATQDGMGSKKLGDLDRQLGVESPTSEGGNAPSFTIGTQKIKELFKEKKYEDALIETNELLKHYPRSAQLLLMKGTLHQRLGQVDLALAAYQRSFEYEPSRKLQAQISNLKNIVNERETLRRQREGVVKPGGTVKIETVPAPQGK